MKSLKVYCPDCKNDTGVELIPVSKPVMYIFPCPICHGNIVCYSPIDEQSEELDKQTRLKIPVEYGFGN